MREIKQDIFAISTATPIFFRSGNLVRLVRMLRDLTGSAKSKMAATKPEVTTYELVDKLATKFQRFHLCFKGSAFKWDERQYCRIKLEV